MPPIDDNVVVRLEFLTHRITDISPLRALPRLRHLVCADSRAGNGRLVDLSPRKEMKLQFLNCNFTRVADLSPLHGIPLRQLHCTATEVHDLTPLQGMPLTFLTCDIRGEETLAFLRTFPQLQTINQQPAAKFWVATKASRVK